MPFYSGFFLDDYEIIKEAFSCVMEKVDAFYKKKLETIESFHRKTIEEKYGSEREKIEKTIDVAKNLLGEGFYTLSVPQHKRLMSFVRSALEIYLKETEKAKEESQLDSFDKKIQIIKRILKGDGVQSGDSTLFDKYYEVNNKTSSDIGKKIFLSYSNKDKDFAGKISDLLRANGFEVFLAHQTINVSDNWRNEILKHLREDNIMIPLLTRNYVKSVWTNQEAGYMIAKNAKILPLITENANIKKCGFLETIQGIHVTEENIEKCIEKIITHLKIGV